jgi:hypothetical protein
MVLCFSDARSRSLLHPQPKSNAQSALGTGHLPFPTSNPARGLPYRHSRRLEGALCPVMVVVSSQNVHVEGNARGLGEALEAVGNHLGAEIPNLLPLQPHVYDAEWSVGKIHDGAAEGVVEGAVCGAEAGEACWCAEGLSKGVTEGDADIFGRVVVVDCCRRHMVSFEHHGNQRGTHCASRPCKRWPDSNPRALKAHAACGQGSQCLC